MSYVGGKARGASHILAVLNHPRYDGYDYLEPFVGYAHVLHRVRNKRSYTASDANPLVAALLSGVQRGEALPPITRARYAQLKVADGDKHAKEREEFMVRHDVLKLEVKHLREQVKKAVDAFYDFCNDLYRDGGTAHEAVALLALGAPVEV